MGERVRLGALEESQHYRELAGKHRNIARQCQSSGARQRILGLASWYEDRANHLDTRGVRCVADPDVIGIPGARSGG
jgi:hypothetical protein